MTVMWRQVRIEKVIVDILARWPPPPPPLLILLFVVVIIITIITIIIIIIITTLSRLYNPEFIFFPLFTSAAIFVSLLLLLIHYLFLIEKSVEKIIL